MSESAEKKAVAEGDLDATSKDLAEDKKAQPAMAASTNTVPANKPACQELSSGSGLLPARCATSYRRTSRAPLSGRCRIGIITLSPNDP